MKLGIKLYESKPDNEAWLDLMTSELLKRLKKAGKPPQMGLHAKSMVIDDHIIMVGTFNLDPRSANLNTECVVIVRDQQQARRLKRQMMVEMDAQNAGLFKLIKTPIIEQALRRNGRLFGRGLSPSLSFNYIGIKSDGYTLLSS